MGKALDLTNKSFWNLNVIKRVENSNGGHTRWLCKCKCGKTCVVDGRLHKNGTLKSCGCLPKGRPRGEMSETAMFQPSVSLWRLRKYNDDPWRNLANAIVAVAADDYRSALRNEDEGLLKSLERFFHSEWYRILTDVDADRLLGMLRRERSGSLQAAYI